MLCSTQRESLIRTELALMRGKKKEKTTNGKQFRFEIPNQTKTKPALPSLVASRSYFYKWPSGAAVRVIPVP